jgi:hypothetical protein
MTGLVADIVKAINIPGMSDEELLQDLHTIGDIIVAVLKLDALSKLEDPMSIELNNVEVFEEILSSVFELNIVDAVFEDALVVVIESLLNLDLTNTEYSNIDFDYEQELLVDLTPVQARFVERILSSGRDKLDIIHTIANAKYIDAPANAYIREKRFLNDKDFSNP